MDILSTSTIVRSTININEVLYHHCLHGRSKINAFGSSIDVPSLSQLEAQVVWQHTLDLLTSYVRRLNHAIDTAPDPKPPWWTDVNIARFGETTILLCSLERQLRYAKEARVLFSLPYVPYGESPQQELKRYIGYTTARVLWLFQMKSEGRSTFPSQGKSPLRYDNTEWITIPELQLPRLPDTHKWMCRTREIPWTFECESLFRLVGHIIVAEHRWLDIACKILTSQGLIAKNAFTKVEEFTEPATAEAIALGEIKCNICECAFSDGPGEDVEPAVKTCCGHFFGRVCLQAWVRGRKYGEKKGVPKCPNCRSRLFCKIYKLPQSVQPAVRAYIAYLRSDPDLDRQADDFLLDAREEKMDGCYDVALGTLLDSLYERRVEIKKHKANILVAIRAEKSLRTSQH